MDLNSITELQHIETKEIQSSIDIQQNVPQNNLEVEEQGENYIEPNLTPNYNYNNNIKNGNSTDSYVTPSTPTSGVDTSDAIPTAPVTQTPEVTVVPEQSQTVQPTQSTPTTQELVAPTPTTQKKNP